jgi:hypothetical protein
LLPPDVAFAHEQAITQKVADGVVLKLRFPVLRFVGHEHPLDVGGVREHVRVNGAEFEVADVAVRLGTRRDEREGVAGVLPTVSDDRHPARAGWFGTH